MKIAVIVIRILLGALMTFSAVSYFFNLMPMPPMEGEVQKFMIGIDATVYMMPLIKAIELIVGIALITGYFIPLATVVIFPISLNIFLFHLFMKPDGILIGAIVLAANLFIAYYYRAYYTRLFESGRAHKSRVSESIKIKTEAGLNERLSH